MRGNNEEYLVSLDRGSSPPAWHTSRQWAALRWSWQRTGRAALDYVATLPPRRTVCLPGTAPVLLVHGSPQGVAHGRAKLRAAVEQRAVDINGEEAILRHWETCGCVTRPMCRVP